MNFMSLDLELNQPSNKIIQVGAVIGNLETGEVLEKINCYVKLDEELNPFIIELTKITPELLQTQGMSLQLAYQRLVEAHIRHLCFRNVITWGGGDSRLLMQQLGLDEESFQFGRRWVDIKTIFQFWRLAQGQKMQGGLARSLTKVGLTFKGTKHSALDDAYNTFMMAHQLLKLMGKVTQKEGISI